MVAGKCSREREQLSELGEGPGKGGVEGLMGNTKMLDIKGLGDWFHMKVKEEI